MHGNFQATAASKRTDSKGANFPRMTKGDGTPIPNADQNAVEPRVCRNICSLSPRFPLTFAPKPGAARGWYELESMLKLMTVTTQPLNVYPAKQHAWHACGGTRLGAQLVSRGARQCRPDRRLGKKLIILGLVEMSPFLHTRPC